MRILLLAPHPFYQERGTPIAVDLLAKALSERGEQVDILTYHEGEDRPYAGDVSIHRIAPPRFASGVRPGFSIKKLICDAAMYPMAAAMAEKHAYDCIHAVEESVFMARRIGKKHGIPYIFDMDSSMPQQIADKLPIAKPILPIMRALEAGAIRSAAAIVPMCDALADAARTMGAKHIEVLRDISLLPEVPTRRPERGFREALQIQGPTLLYLGNLESYQGIDLMLESFALTGRKNPDANLVIAGGRADDIEKYREKTATLGIASRVHFLGPRPLSHMPDLFQDADILVSPRTQGANTPMKIYSYLDANRAILATDLPTHTQVLNRDVAELVPPTCEAMAEGMGTLLQQKERRERLGSQARMLAQECYSLRAFRAGVNRLYDYIANLP
ncbi:MAG: glycosyltransferase family 4 protein [Verrucomicrobia bacterium]|jgi:glycosyltransferase involved in cell wall biosynthesis|nr:glycosyltransferase family 4 protein [Verrucomicrobiota bacterium]